MNYNSLFIGKTAPFSMEKHSTKIAALPLGSLLVTSKHYGGQKINGMVHLDDGTPNEQNKPTAWYGRLHPKAAQSLSIGISDSMPYLFC